MPRSAASIPKAQAEDATKEVVLDLKISITSDAVFYVITSGVKGYPCCILVASVILELHKTQLLTSAQQGVAQAPKVKAAKVRADLILGRLSEFGGRAGFASSGCRPAHSRTF